LDNYTLKNKKLAKFQHVLLKKSINELRRALLPKLNSTNTLQTTAITFSSFKNNSNKSQIGLCNVLVNQKPQVSIANQHEQDRR